MLLNTHTEIVLFPVPGGGYWLGFCLEQVKGSSCRLYKKLDGTINNTYLRNEWVSVKLVNPVLRGDNRLHTTVMECCFYPLFLGLLNNILNVARVNCIDHIKYVLTIWFTVLPIYFWEVYSRRIIRPNLLKHVFGAELI